MASNVTRAPGGDMETITQLVSHSAVGLGGQDCYGNGRESHTSPVSISGRAQGVGEQRGNVQPAVPYGMVFAGFPCLLAPEVDGWASGDTPQFKLFQNF